MITIRLAKRQWGKAWRAMIEVGPIHLISKDAIYKVLPVHLELLEARGFSYEIIKRRVGKRAQAPFTRKNA